jgi:hypothetical protein
MSVVIRLDSKALSMLLKEFGDEFLLELKTAVFNNALERHIKAVVPAEVTDLIDEAVRSEVKKQIGTVNWKGYAKLESGIESKIQQLTRDAVSNIVREELKEPSSIIQERIDTHVSSLEYELAHKVRKWINSTLDGTIRDAVKTRVALALEMESAE